MRVSSHGGLFLGLRRFLSNRIAVMLYVVIVLAALFCLIHNMVLRRQAESLLHDLEWLRPGVSTMADARQVAAKHHMQNQASDASCTNLDCEFFLNISEDKGVMLAIDAAQDAAIKTTLLDAAGLRKWSFWTKISVQSGLVKSVAVEVFVTHSFLQYPYLGWGWHRVSTSFTTEIPAFVLESGSAHSGLARNRDYLPKRRPKDFIVFVTPVAGEQKIQAAFDYNLDCFTRMAPCRHYADIVPIAWNDLCSEQANCQDPFE